MRIIMKNLFYTQSLNKPDELTMPHFTITVQ